MHSSNAVLVAAVLFFSNAAFSADYPVCNNGVLTLPRVDTLDQAGKYPGHIMCFRVERKVIFHQRVRRRE